MTPPCRPGRRVSRSHRRALCQSFTACLPDIAANRTGPATLPGHTGQGARVWENPGSTTEIESKGASGVAAQPARERLILGALCRYTPKGLAKFGEVGKSRYSHITRCSRPRPVCRPAFRGGFCVSVVLVSRPRTNGAVRTADSVRTASVHQNAVESNRLSPRWESSASPAADSDATCRMDLAGIQ